MFIKISEYAKKHGKTLYAIHRQIDKGALPVTRSGNRYYVEESTPYPEDARVKHGAYIGIRQKLK